MLRFILKNRFPKFFSFLCIHPILFHQLQIVFAKYLKVNFFFFVEMEHHKVWRKSRTVAQSIRTTKWNSFPNNNFRKTWLFVFKSELIIYFFATVAFFLSVFFTIFLIDFFIAFSIFDESFDSFSFNTFFIANCFKFL